MPSSSASRTSTGYRMSAPKLVTSLSGVLRKRLKLTVVSAKNPEGVSAYRIT